MSTQESRGWGQAGDRHPPGAAHRHPAGTGLHRPSHASTWASSRHPVLPGPRHTDNDVCVGVDDVVYAGDLVRSADPNFRTPSATLGGVPARAGHPGALHRVASRPRHARDHQLQLSQQADAHGAGPAPRPRGAGRGGPLHRGDVPPLPCRRRGPGVASTARRAGDRGAQPTCRRRPRSRAAAAAIPRYPPSA
ncbi:hypothetical protein QJS66_19160 [Kocuria rhizophila]|nr:hypothetical protein QJS66_19160 [Kocuria rhizophila]